MLSGIDNLHVDDDDDCDSDLDDASFHHEDNLMTVMIIECTNMR